MIPRDSRPQMAAIWEPENYYRIQLAIETYACEAQARLGVIPESAAQAVREKGAFEGERIKEIEPKYTATVARSHGIHAEPTTFGVKLAGHWAEFARNRERLVAARREIATCAISGAVGTFANIDPRVEA